MIIPFEMILIILIAVGVVGFLAIMSRAKDYDFITPMLALGFALFFIVLAVGLVIGKLVF